MGSEGAGTCPALASDFSTKGMSAQELTAVVAACQAAAINRETITELFQRGEILPEGRTIEEAKAFGREAVQGPRVANTRDRLFIEVSCGS